MKNTFYSFDGVTFISLSDPLTDFINVSFDIDNGEITAETSTGGFPHISYDMYNPNLPEGTAIGSQTIGAIKYNFFWSYYYPFATYTQETVTPPIYDLTINAVSTNETAPNERDGTVTVTASGGIAPYEYSLNNIDWQSSNIFIGLSFGNYTVFVRDNSTGLGQASFTIEAGQYPPAPPVIAPQQDIICLSDGELERKGGFKRATVITEFGTTPATLFNGDFEEYDGQNWNQWIKYGGINVSRGQRSITNGSGNPVLIENYTMVFNQAADAGKYVEHIAIPVIQGDTGKFSINIGKTIGTGFTTGILQLGAYNIPSEIYTFYEFRMRIKIGNFYLYNVGSGKNFEWVSQLAVITTEVYNDSGDVSSFVFNFNIPEIPATGNMFIEIFGFAKTRVTTTKEFRPTFGVVISPQYIRTTLPEYNPIEIDDVKFEKSSQNKDNDINSITNISDNLDYFTEPLEPIEIPIGDLYFGDIGKNEFEILYAIYDQDNKPTTGWIEFGVSNEPRPFGLSLARSLMQSYQASYYEWSGQLMLKDGADRFSYLDTFSFDVNLVSGLPATDFNSIQFVLLGCDIDLKTNIMSNIRMREYFRRVARTSDVSVPTSPNTPLPPIVNDPNNNQLIGIFTEEFDDVFN